jgi:ribosomal protein S3
MRVFYKSMVDEIDQMMRDFENQYGVKPTHVEMSRVEYRKLQDQLKARSYSHRIAERPTDEITILGLLIIIKE